MTSLQPGRSLLHYRIVEKIGQGGMGEVYKAEDTKLGRLVAIKVLAAKAREDERARKRLLLEARSASALNHPNIVTIHAIEEAEGMDFFVMEYAEGESLAARIGRGPLELPQLLDLGMQLADALAAAHAIGLIHRDIKSANILLTPRGQAKVLDFGLAKPARAPAAAQADGETQTMEEAALTAHGAIVGTAAYMSPEQARGEPLDRRSDIFSLGCVLYEAATGRLPFRGPSVLHILHEIATASPLPVTTARAGLPAELDAIVRRALAKNREARYESAAELGTALETLRSGVGLAEAAAPAETAERELEAFVGREAEMAKLDGWMHEAVGGSGQIVFLTGEPGIGKTSLAGEFLRRARREHPGLLIGRGRCVEQYGAGEAYLPFLDAVGGMLSRPGRERVEAVLRAHAPTWCVQFPSTFVSSGDVEKLRRETIGATKERMLREMGDALGALASGSPVALLLEDLHWADPSSTDLLRHLGQRASSQRLLVLGTFRPEDVEVADHPLKNCKREMQAHNLCREIALPTLRQEHIERYLDARFAPNNFPPDFAALLQRRTEGHPLFATGLVQYLLERGDIARRNEHWSLARAPQELDLEAPEGVRSMIRKKIEALGEDDRRALQYASIEGEEFTSTVLAVLLGVDEVALEERLDRLGRLNRLVQTLGEEELPDGALATRYRFAHALYQNLFYDDLVSKRRILLHRQAGEELARRYGKQASRIAAQLAVHFERGRDFARAIDHWTQAADNAIGLWANTAAEEHITRAIDLVAKLPEAEQARRRALLYHKRGTVNLVLFRLGQAEQDFAAMGEAARQLGDAALECTALNGRAFAAFWAHNLDGLGTWAGEALRVAERVGDPALRAESLLSLARLDQGLGRLEEENARLEELIPVVRSLGNQRVLTAALTSRGMTHFWQCEYELAQERLQEACTVASQVRDGFHLTNALFFLGLSQGNLGRISQARATMNETIEMSRRNGNVMVLSKMENCQGWLHCELEDLDGAIEHDLEGVEIPRKSGVPEAEANALLNLALCYARSGQSGKALPALRRVEEICDLDQWHRWRFLGVRYQAAAAEYWLAKGEPARAAEYAQRLVENATHHRARKYAAVGHQLLAQVANVRGELASAEQELAAALEALREHPTPLVAWRIHADLGRVRAQQGRAEAARQDFARAAAIVGSIADSIDDSRLRARFLESRAVKEIL